MSKNLSKIIFLFIILLSLFLRLSGIANGFPFISHPDEPTIVRSALGVRFFPNPGHFDWPHLYIYLNYFVYMVFAKFRDILVSLDFKDTLSPLFPLIWNDNLIFYLITRILTAVLGALTVIPVYLTGKRLFGEKAGLFGALAFALIPFHIRHSHYSLPDAPMVFLMSWAMYFASGVLVKNDSIQYSGAGFYTGLAASTKYNGGLSAFMIPLAHIIRSIKDRVSPIEFSGIMNLILAGIVAIIGFVLGTPFAVIDYSTFLRNDGPAGAMWQFKNVGSVILSQRPEKFVNEMIYRVADDMGYTIILGFFIVFLILAARLIIKKTRDVDYNAWFIFLTGTFLLFYISGFERSRSHYYMIAYPFVSVTFGYFCSQLFNFIEIRKKAVVLIFLAIIYAFPLYYATKQSFIFSRPDTRNLLNDWLTNNLTEQDTIIYNSDLIKNVVELHNVKNMKDLDNIAITSKGYLLIAYEESLGGDAFTLLKHSSNLTKVFETTRELNNGPNIFVYKIVR